MLDTHIDTTPKLQQQGWNFAEEHRDGHIDLPRMKKGGLNALFFSIYMPGTVTGPKAVQDSIERIAAVHGLAEQLPDQIALATTAAEVRRAREQGKIAALMGIDSEFYDAAKIDGASKLRQAFSISVPMIKPMISMNPNIISIFSETWLSWLIAKSFAWPGRTFLTRPNFLLEL